MNYQEIFLQQLTEYSHKDAVFVDIGCGKNEYLDLVNKRLGIGIDVELPSGLQNKNLIIGDIEEIPLKNSCCDIVIARMVLEHLKSPHNIVKEINRILSPGGLFLFVTPGRYYPISLVALLIPSNRLRGLLVGHRVYTTYYRLNTISRIRKLLSSLGFQEAKLIRTFDPTSFRFKGLNLLIWLLNKVYKSNVSKLLPPHHIIGVFIKGDNKLNVETAYEATESLDKEDSNLVKNG